MAVSTEWLEQQFDFNSPWNTEFRDKLSTTMTNIDNLRSAWRNIVAQMSSMSTGNLTNADIAGIWDSLGRVTPRPEHDPALWVETKRILTVLDKSFYEENRDNFATQLPDGTIYGLNLDWWTHHFLITDMVSRESASADLRLAVDAYGKKREDSSYVMGIVLGRILIEAINIEASKTDWVLEGGGIPTDTVYQQFVNQVIARIVAIASNDPEVQNYDLSGLGEFESGGDFPYRDAITESVAKSRGYHGTVSRPTDMLVSPSSTEVAGRIPEGDPFLIYWRDDMRVNWVRVEYDGKFGYLYDGYITDQFYMSGNRRAGSVTAGSTVEYATVTTQGGHLNLRREPIDGEILAYIPHGSRVQLIARDEDHSGWHMILYKQLNGYVSGEYLTFDDQPKSTVAIETGSIGKLLTIAGSGYLAYKILDNE